MSQEYSIARAKAAVMVYEDKTKKWIPSSGMNGFANVHIYQHTTNNSFRIVGRLIQDHTVVINASLVKGLRYNIATPTFHQWRDQRQVYGLNFAAKGEAEEFAKQAQNALEQLASGQSIPPPQVAGNLQKQQQAIEEIDKKSREAEEAREREVQIRREREEEMKKKEEEQRRLEIEAEKRRQEEKQKEAEERERRERIEKERLEREKQVEREREAELEKAKEFHKEKEVQLRQDHFTQDAEVERRSRGAPPAAPERRSSIQEPIPGAVATPPIANSPTPPPPPGAPPPPPAAPPPPAVPSGNSTTTNPMTSLSGALQSISLKSADQPGSKANSAAPMSVMDEMAVKLKKRRAAADSGPTTTDGPQLASSAPGVAAASASPSPTPASGSSDLSALLAKRRAASEAEGAVAAGLAKSGPATAPRPKAKLGTKSDEVGTTEQMQQLKEEIMEQIRKELEKTKQEIIAAVKSEIAKALNK